MATALLSSLGASVAGPFGQLAGAAAGGAIDDAVLGGRSGRLVVQSAAYGAPIPRVYGTMRVEGGLIWATPLREEGVAALNKVFGAQGRSYTVSVAVALSARPIQRVARIWADGKLIRDASGRMSIAGALRVHTGGERQAPDPLIASAEGAGAAAFRGVAYVVFENLQLGAFGNRLPRLAFEVVADEATPGVGAIAADLFTTAGLVAPVETTGAVAGLVGWGTVAGALDDALGELAAIAPIVVDATRSRPRLRTAADAVVAIDAAQVAIGDGGAPADVAARASRGDGGSGVELGYFDPARDFQGGLQRGRAGRGTVAGVRVAAALEADAARGIAERLADERGAARRGRTLSVSVTAARPPIGGRVRVGDETGTWRVTAATCEGLIWRLELVADAVAAGAPVAADAGRALGYQLPPAAPAILRVLDIPDFTGGSDGRAWLAVSSAGGWRGVDMQLSQDGGATYASLGAVRNRAVIATALGVLPPGETNVWDTISSVDVEVAHADDWLLSRTVDDVLAGANLIAIGGEIVAFRQAAAIGARRFRLSGLLRGRFGTEWAVGTHVAGEDAVLLNRAALVSLPVAPGLRGVPLRLRAVGPTDTPATAVTAAFTPALVALQPPAPVRARVLRMTDGALAFSWVRRSRLGLGWPDGSDAPLGEEREAYTLDFTVGAVTWRAEAAACALTVSAAEQIARLGALAPGGSVAIAQSSAVAGPGRAARLDF